MGTSRHPVVYRVKCFTFMEYRKLGLNESYLRRLPAERDEHSRAARMRLAEHLRALRRAGMDRTLVRRRLQPWND